MDEDVTVDFREGYGEGLTEGVAMFRRAIGPLQRAGREQFASDLEDIVSVAEGKVEVWRSRLGNI